MFVFCSFASQATSPELCICLCWALFCVVFDMSSDHVRISKHSLVHQASKGCKVAANQLETLRHICEVLLDKPGRICDVQNKKV